MLALVLVSQGVVQTFGPYAKATVVQPSQYDEPVTDKDGKPVLDAKGQPKTKKSTLTEQVIAVGPAASQIAIKQLGTNGGGFFNVNSAHPFENPTPLSNFLELLAILLIPAALCYTFGVMVGDTRQGWAVLAAMTVIFVALLAVVLRGRAERRGLREAGRRPHRRARSSRAATWRARRSASASPTRPSGPPPPPRPPTARSTRCTTPITPLGGLVPMWLMQLGEVVFGGVGSGLYGMLVFAIIAVFVAGLMVGRTPEYLGKKIEAYEMKMASLVILIPPALVLIGTAVGGGRARRARPASPTPAPTASARSSTPSPRRATTTAAPSPGLSANTPFYNTALGLAMLFGRYWLAIPSLAIAGSLARKKIVPAGPGHAAHAHAAVRRPAGRRGDPGRRADLRPGAGARADRRASHPDRREVRS